MRIDELYAGSQQPIAVQKHLQVVAPSQHPMGRELLASRSDRTTRIPPGVASLVTTNHAAKGSVFGNVKCAGSFKNWPAVVQGFLAHKKRPPCRTLQ